MLMKPGRDSPRKYVAILVVLIVMAIGLELRVRAVLETDVDRPLRADAGQYFLYAYNLKFHGTYTSSPDAYTKKDIILIPDAIRSPGYPLFLALFVDGRPTKSMYYRILIAQSVLGTITILLVYVLSQFLMGFWPAAIAAFLTAIDPHLINLSVYILTETLFSFVLVLSFCAFLLIKRQNKSWIFLASGLGLGAASLVRPSLQYFIFVFVAWLIMNFGFRKGGRLAVMVLIGAGLLFAPWFIRNLHSIGSLSDSRLKISTLHHGMYPNFRYREDPRSYGYPYRFDPRSAEISKDLLSALYEIRRRFSSEPLRHFKWYLFGKPLTFWSWNVIQGAGDTFIYPVRNTPYENVFYFRWSHNFMNFLHWPLVILGLLGMIFVWMPFAVPFLDRYQNFLARSVSILLFYFTLLHMIGAPFPRYSTPIRPFLYGMAVFAIFLAVDRYMQVWRNQSVRPH